MISPFNDVSEVDVWNLGTETNHISAQTLELNLLIFIKGNCQVSKVEDLSFYSSLSGQSSAPYSEVLH